MYGTPGFKFKNEYKDPSSGSTGGHFHFEYVDSIKNSPTNPTPTKTPSITLTNDGNLYNFTGDNSQLVNKIQYFQDLTPITEGKQDSLPKGRYTAKVVIYPNQPPKNYPRLKEGQTGSYFFRSSNNKLRRAWADLNNSTGF